MTWREEQVAFARCMQVCSETFCQTFSVLVSFIAGLPPSSLAKKNSLSCSPSTWQVYCVLYRLAKLFVKQTKCIRLKELMWFLSVITITSAFNFISNVVINIMPFFKLLAATTEKELNDALEVLEHRHEIDGIPPLVTMENREDFARLYSHHELIIKKKPYLDQLTAGLNHYGVSNP